MRFLAEDEGAVTVDWVVLTAALAFLGVTVAVVVVTGLKDLTHEIDDELQEVEVGTTFAAIRTNAYEPFDAAYYEGWMAALSNLSDEDLDAVEAFANDSRATLQPQVRTAADQGALDDTSAGIDAVYAERGRDRPHGTDADHSEVVRIVNEQNWNAATLSAF